MIKMNPNAMTDQEIIQQYRGLLGQIATIEKVGRAIVGDAIKEKLATLKQAMDDRSLT